VMAAMSLLYTAGMYLNDAFDWRSDAVKRPERPIPSGATSATVVFTAGYGMLAGGIALLGAAGFAGLGAWTWRPITAAAVLSAAILYYDIRHKRDPLSPLWMGLCRTMVYIGAAWVATPQPAGTVYAAAITATCYLIGLTYIAKQETLQRVTNLWPLLFLAAPLVYAARQGSADQYGWLLLVVLAAWVGYALHFLWRRRPGDIPRAVVSLIAGIALLDGLFLALWGRPDLALAAVAGFVLTLGLQRFVPGT
jgi:hypothetical protein